MPSRFLICGTAGYIGSHMLKWLAQRGHSITVLDNFSTGHREAVRGGEFVQADLLEPRGRCFTEAARCEKFPWPRERGLLAYCVHSSGLSR